MSTESAAPSRSTTTTATSTVRRAVRETALRILYTVDTGKWSAEEAIVDSTSAEELSEAGREMLRTLIAKTLENRDAIDAALDRFATDFPVQRQAVVDRNILRLATAEILFAASDAPAGAVVNEAVELAKKYSTKDSGRFVNGVLGALVRDHEKLAETSQPAETETDA